MSPILTSSAAGAPTRGAAHGSHVDAARQAAAPRALATLLLAAAVAALAVVTDRLIDTWTDGHLLAAWVLMWAVVFLGSVLLASPARHAARRVGALLDDWARRRALARAAARTAALARQDTRLQAELAALRARSDAAPQAWEEALAPLAPDLAPSAAALAARWALSQAELVTMPDGRRYSLYCI